MRELAYLMEIINKEYGDHEVITVGKLKRAYDKAVLRMEEEQGRIENIPLDPQFDQL
ncbi:hypothetical protein PP178_04205 [Zeaxanthinibacter sp. PT1]|uniref:hypothetical protein n=1 Tax=Zeaxanthinibacter TaxID=561554 RepID=UPI00234BC52E|nr:hypothetical protein [Zeaxanthinibacter sp. PT1]MDC6350744.1 hypothetical protein [Zeaxanthinibacter sp. PT1]